MVSAASRSTRGSRSRVSKSASRRSRKRVGTDRAGDGDRSDPTANWYGVSDVTIRATDPGALWNEDTFRISVNAVNDAPVISGLPDQTLNEDGSLNNAIDLWAYASDVETPDSGLTFTITANTVPSCGVSIDSNRYIDINPVADW